MASRESRASPAAPWTHPQTRSFTRAAAGAVCPRATEAGHGPALGPALGRGEWALCLGSVISVSPENRKLPQEPLRASFSSVTSRSCPRNRGCVHVGSYTEFRQQLKSIDSMTERRSVTCNPRDVERAPSAARCALSQQQPRDHHPRETPCTEPTSSGSAKAGGLGLGRSVGSDGRRPPGTLSPQFPSSAPEPCTRAFPGL